MNNEELKRWKEGVIKHMSSVQTIIDDRSFLKQMFETHLKSFFDYDEIEYNRDFTEITLKWNPDHNPSINHRNIADLGMDWSISSNFDEDELRTIGVEIILYPFGGA